MKYTRLLKAAMAVSGWRQNRGLFIRAKTYIIRHLLPKYFLQICSGTTSRIVLLIARETLSRFLTKRITWHLILLPLLFEMRATFYTVINCKKITTPLSGVYRGQFIQFQY